MPLDAERFHRLVDDPGQVVPECPLKLLSLARREEQTFAGPRSESLDTEPSHPWPAGRPAGRLAAGPSGGRAAGAGTGGSSAGRCRGPAAQNQAGSVGRWPLGPRAWWTSSTSLGPSTSSIGCSAANFSAAIEKVLVVTKKPLWLRV